MSKDFTNEELFIRKDNIVKSLDQLLTSFLESSDSHLQKKASLLSYWLDSFFEYIREEDAFDSTKLKSYKRGDVIRVNFGFNVGSEYGGLHYAIVINNHNPRNSSVLTVIPLTSQKDGNKSHPNDVYLGNELYRNLKLKHDTLSQNLQAEKKEIENMIGLFDSILKAIDLKLELYESEPSLQEQTLEEARRYLDTAKQLQKDWIKKSQQNKSASEQFRKIGLEIKRMKTGSIALVDQITTVSKMRIYDPRNARGVLSGIRLSPEALDKINAKLKELFVF